MGILPFSSVISFFGIEIYDLLIAKNWPTFIIYIAKVTF
jgi:hypothetical protein